MRILLGIELSEKTKKKNVKDKKIQKNPDRYGKDETKAGADGAVTRHCSPCHGKTCRVTAKIPVTRWNFPCHGKLIIQQFYPRGRKDKFWAVSSAFAIK